MPPIYLPVKAPMYPCRCAVLQILSAFSASLLHRALPAHFLPLPERLSRFFWSGQSVVAANLVRKCFRAAHSKTDNHVDECLLFSAHTSNILLCGSSNTDSRSLQSPYGRGADDRYK